MHPWFLRKATKVKYFSLPLDTITDLGVIDLSDLAAVNRTRVILAFDPETDQEVSNRVEEIEKIKVRGKFFVINDKVLLYENQSIFVNGMVNHVKNLKVGDQLIGLRGVKVPITSIQKVTGTHYFFKLKVSGNHGYFINGLLMHNASRFWVGGTGNWSPSDTTHWAATTGGAGGQSVPTSSDDVTFNLNSNEATDAAYTFTIATGAANCNNLDISFTGTTKVTWAGSQALNIFGNLNLSGGTGQITRTYTGAITFSAVATGKTVTMNSVTLASASTFNGVGGGWTLQDNFTSTQASGITLTNGTLNTNGKTVTVPSFASNNANTRTLTLGASPINLTNAWTFTDPTGLTFNVNTSVITVTSATAHTFAGGGLTYNSVIFNGIGRSSVTGINSFANLTRTGTAAKTDSISFAANQTITTLFTINGQSTINRVLVESSTKGTARTLTSASNAFTNLDFQDMTAAGAGSWSLAAISGLSGDCGGNTGITFTTPVLQHWLNASSSSWSTAANWTSRVPLPQDNVVMDKAFGVSQTVTMDMPRMGASVDWTGATWTTALTWTMGVSSSLFGSLTMINGLTLGMTSTPTLTFEGRGSYTFTSNALSFLYHITIDSVASVGTVTLGGNLTVGPLVNLTVTSGLFTVSASNFVISTGTMVVGASGTFTMGTATMLVTGVGGTVWSVTAAATINPSTSTIKITDTTNGLVTFAGGGQTYNNIWYARGASTGINRLSGSNTFNDFKTDGTEAHSFEFTQGTTTTVTTFTVSGSSGKLVTINSASSSTLTHALNKAGGGIISRTFLNIQHSVAGPGNWYAGLNSTDNQGVATAGSGWIFNVPPIPSDITQAPPNQAINRAATF